MAARPSLSCRCRYSEHPSPGYTSHGRHFNLGRDGTVPGGKRPWRGSAAAAAPSVPRVVLIPGVLPDARNPFSLRKRSTGALQTLGTLRSPAPPRSTPPQHSRRSCAWHGRRRIRWQARARSHLPLPAGAVRRSLSETEVAPSPETAKRSSTVNRTMPTPSLKRASVSICGIDAWTKFSNRYRHIPLHTAGNQPIPRRPQKHSSSCDYAVDRCEG